MDYQEALDYISASGRFGIKMGLERTRALLDAMGGPDQGMAGVLVAGTNGKGSTCANLVACLRAAGYRVGSMPKPHLQSYTERVRVDGVPISEDDFAQMIELLQPVVESIVEDHGQATEFEMLTAAAIRYLRDQQIDYLVCEVGMGGRVDSTNVLDLGVKVITNVELDHMSYLGATVAEIAAEKAGIIRAGDITVTGRLGDDAEAVVRGRAEEVGARLWGLDRGWSMETESLGWHGSRFAAGDPTNYLTGLETPLLGPHQALNAAVAMTAMFAMAERHGTRFSEDDIRTGLRAATNPGRLELVDGSPPVLIDGGHNPAAVKTVVEAVQELLAGESGPRRVVVLFGAMGDKDWESMEQLLPAEWPVVFTAVDEERAEPPLKLLKVADKTGREQAQAVEGSAAALDAARTAAGDDGMVLVLGSLYLAGEVRQAMGLR